MSPTPTPLSTSPDASSLTAPASAAWRDYGRLRGYQRRLGVCCAVFLALALLALLDGAQGLMRAGAGVLDLVPGQGLEISGPAALKNPVDSDLQAVFTPSVPDLTFRLEGFFTGYWMGNGMWRAAVAAGPSTEPGRYDLLVRFRGAPPSTEQHLTVQVYADARSLRAASLSLLQRLLGWNPFILAASLCPVLQVGCWSLPWAVAARICWRPWAAVKCCACSRKRQPCVCGVCCWVRRPRRRARPARCWTRKVGPWSRLRPRPSPPNPVACWNCCWNNNLLPRRMRPVPPCGPAALCACGPPRGCALLRTQGADPWPGRAGRVPRAAYRRCVLSPPAKNSPHR